MKIDFQKDIFIDYIKDNVENKVDFNCAYLLYKKYNLINKITKNKAYENIQLIDEIEDNIYTINGKKLDDLTRISLELRIIEKKYSTLELPNEDILLQITLVKQLYNELSSQNIEQIFEIKKQISILQAKLGINPSFMYASYAAFEDVYKNILIGQTANSMKVK